MKWHLFAVGLASFFIQTEPVLAQSIGSTNEVLAFPLHAEANWVGFPQCTPEDSHPHRRWTPESGWAIVSHRSDPGTPGGNGHIVAEIVEAGGPSFPGIPAVNTQFNLALALAQSKHNTEAQTEIRKTQTSWLSAREGVNTTNNQLFAQVSATGEGSCTDKKGSNITAQFFVTQRYVGDEQALNRTVNALIDKYKLLDGFTITGFAP